MTVQSLDTPEQKAYLRKLVSAWFGWRFEVDKTLKARDEADANWQEALKNEGKIRDKIGAYTGKQRDMVVVNVEFDDVGPRTAVIWYNHATNNAIIDQARMLITGETE